MLGAKAFLRGCSRLALVASIAVVAASADGQKPPAAFKKSPEDCFKAPLVLPEDQMARIAADCGTQYLQAPKLPDQLANAGLNSGTAHNNLGEFAMAMPILEPVSRDQRASPSTRNEAKYQLGRAYIGLAPTAAPAEKSSLYTKGLSTLEDYLNSGVQRGSPAYNLAVYQRALAYLGRGAGTLDYNNAVDSFAVLADGGPSVDPNLARDARQNLISVALKAGASEMTASAANNDSPGAQRAAAFYEKALKYDPRNPELNLRLGDARLVIGAAAAVPDKAGWYQQAQAAYNLAGATGPNVGSVNLGLGRATRGLGQLPEAIGYFKLALAGDPSNQKLASELVDVQLEQARALKDPGARPAAYKDAEQTFQSMLAQPGLSIANKASILMRLADVQGQQPGRTDDVRKTLLAAIAADPTSTSAALQVGMTLYAQQDLDAARRYFQQVIAMTGGPNSAPGPGETDTKADAYYYLSLISDRNGVAGPVAELTDAVKYADEAVKLGASRTSYREQACISRLMRGGAAVTPDTAVTACGSGDQAPGMLLLGMFNLRKARYVSTTLRPAALQLAQVWFDSGIREIERTPAAVASGRPERERGANLKWPGVAGSPNVGVMLKYGRAKVISCLGLNTDASLTADEIGQAQKFFAIYGVDDCSHLQ